MFPTGAFPTLLKRAVKVVGNLLMASTVGIKLVLKTCYYGFKITVWTVK